jgi:hypothetical protein
MTTEPATLADFSPRFIYAGRKRMRQAAGRGSGLRFPGRSAALLFGTESEGVFARLFACGSIN